MNKFFNPETHKNKLLQILFDIEGSFSSWLIFKGGTAAMLFYGLPRISLDLDFDLVSPLDKEKWDRLKILLQRHGKIKKIFVSGYNHFFILEYISGHPGIKLQFNNRLWKNNRTVLMRLMGIPFQIADKGTMLTHKLIALAERKSPVARDLFDCWFFLHSGFEMYDKLLKERIGKNRKEYLKFLLKFIPRNFHSRNVLLGMGDLLDPAQKKWTKENLVNETMREIKKVIG